MINNMQKPYDIYEYVYIDSKLSSEFVKKNMIKTKIL